MARSRAASGRLRPSAVYAYPCDVHDINPIEHVWAYLKDWIYSHHPELLKLTGESQEVKDQFLASLQEG